MHCIPRIYLRTGSLCLWPVSLSHHHQTLPHPLTITTDLISFSVHLIEFVLFCFHFYSVYLNWKQKVSFLFHISPPPHPPPLAVTDLFSVSLGLVFVFVFVFRFCIKGRNVALVLLWFISLSIMSLMSIHVAENGRISKKKKKKMAGFHSYGWIIFLCIYVPHSLYLISFDGCLDFFYVLTMTNSFPMNLKVHISFWVSVFFFFEYIARSEIAGSYECSMFIFWGISIKFFIYACTNFYFQQKLHKDSPSSTSLPTLVTSFW